MKNPEPKKDCRTRTLASDLFQEMVSREPEQIDLAVTALLIALDEYPGLNVRACLQKIDGLAVKIAPQLPFCAADRPMDAIETINRQLFRVEGFHGNQRNYYDPRNSFLNDVIQRKTGIPITLSVLYMEVGKRLGLRLEGVGMPGHFIVKCVHEGLEIFIDPFNCGQILLEEDCRKKLAQMHGQDFQFERSCLNAVNNRQILARMLGNLKGIYWNQQNYGKVLAIIEKILFIDPDAAGELRDRGFAHYQLNHLSLAMKDWFRYLELRPAAPDASEVEKSLKLAGHSLAFRN